MVGTAWMERIDLVVAAPVGVLPAIVAVGVELAVIVGPAGARTLIELCGGIAAVIPGNRRSDRDLPAIEIKIGATRVLGDHDRVGRAVGHRSEPRRDVAEQKA